MELLILLFSLPLCITWAYRGGSLYKQQQWGWLGNTRWLTLLATPLFITVTYTVSMSESLTTSNIIGLLFGFISFFGAQADGWGRQMDLGRDSKPDNETGYRLRDLIWKKKSSFSRDLAGLYMRFAQFLIPAFCFGLVNPVLSLSCISLFLLAPLCWVIEHKLYYSKNQVPRIPFVEILIGCVLFVTVAVSSMWVV